jgi:hypothetical protein
MDVSGALQAIASTGDGYCWYCDRKLPEAEEAIGAGWDVQRLQGDPVASIILVCPVYQQEKAELGEEGFLHNLVLRVCNTTC